MSSVAAVQPLTPADLETPRAALGIPVARLVKAARIDRSTWSRWRAGKTQPRIDHWAAATAAFDALVAEATPAPAAPEPEPAEPITLTGSSAPTGGPPSFVPLATAPMLGTHPDAGSEPIVFELRRASDFRALINAGLSDEQSDEAGDRMTDHIDRAAALPVSTPAGAVAVLEWVREEFASTYVEMAQPDYLDVVTLGFIDRALGVFRLSSEGPAPSPSPEVAALTAEWLKWAAEDHRLSEAINVMRPGPAFDLLYHPWIDAARMNAEVQQRIARVRSIAPEVLRLKAAAVLVNLKGSGGLEAEVAGEQCELAPFEQAMLVSLARDVLDMLGPSVLCLADAACTIAGGAETPARCAA